MVVLSGALELASGPGALALARRPALGSRAATASQCSAYYRLMS